MKSSQGFFAGRLSPAFLLAGIILLLSCMVMPAAANPPSAMSLSYDPVSSVLSVTVTHPVAGASGHYIKDVKLSVNGNVVSNNQYTSQPSDTFTYTYPVTLKPGDTVEAVATCSLAGSATRSYTMPAAAAAPSGLASQPAAGTSPPGSPGPVPSPTQKASAAIIPVITGIGMVLLFRKKT